MMEIFSLVLILLVAFLTCNRTILGICAFISIRILIPENVRVFNNIISLNTAIIIVITLVYGVKFVYQRCKYRVNRYTLILLLFFAYSAVVLPFSCYGSLMVQYLNLIQFAITDILPVLLALNIIKNYKDLRCVIKTLLISTLICCGYAIITYLIKENPYVNTLAKITSPDASSVGWRGFSTSGTFLHANGFGYFLTMMVPFLFYLNAKLSNKRMVNLTKATVILALICVLLCKKRTAIISIGFFFLCWFVLKPSARKGKILIASIISMMILLSVLFMVPSFNTLSNYIKASIFFWNDNAVEGVISGGSTWALRIRQLIYPYVEIQKNLILGHGFGWTRWYLDTFKLHPILYGFETILAEGICNFGMMGFLVYGCLFWGSYKFSRIKHNKGTNYQLLFILTVIIMAIGTGINYLYLFFYLIVLMNKSEVCLTVDEKSYCSNSYI